MTSDKNCPCGSSRPLSDCCEPFIQAKSWPTTAEQLMRSRYTAYVLGDVDYIEKTTAPEMRKDFDKEEAREWARNANWRKLQILRTEKGGPSDNRGIVEFQAVYSEKGKALEHHEVSEFRKDSKGHWMFYDGEAHVHNEGEGHHHHHEKPQTVVREQPKIGRNDPCHCGSGKKYKKCHGSAEA